MAIYITILTFIYKINSKQNSKNKKKFVTLHTYITIGKSVAGIILGKSHAFFAIVLFGSTPLPSSLSYHSLH
jgi:hypothetical protein